MLFQTEVLVFVQCALATHHTQQMASSHVVKPHQLGESQLLGASVWPDASQVLMASRQLSALQLAGPLLLASAKVGCSSGPLLPTAILDQPFAVYVSTAPQTTVVTVHVSSLEVCQTNEVGLSICCHRLIKWAYILSEFSLQEAPGVPPACV